ncbi:MAG TPA: GFA family protein [Caulobacteraceae bacterium]|jgi:hypothetical protein|nr:GFA family protein [Caulobacteraceae bacterium]
MKPPHLPLKGECRCGRVKVEITADPIMTAACHCVGCQKMSASAFSMTAIMPADGFRVSQGEPVIGGNHAPDLHHYHCPHCKSWMFTRADVMPGFVNVRPSLFDVRDWFVPFIETMTRDKLPWATTPARHRFEEFPPPESFGPLMAEFAASS